MKFNNNPFKYEYETNIDFYGHCNNNGCSIHLPKSEKYTLPNPPKPDFPFFDRRRYSGKNDMSSYINNVINKSNENVFFNRESNRNRCSYCGRKNARRNEFDRLVKNVKQNTAEYPFYRKSSGFDDVSNDIDSLIKMNKKLYGPVSNRFLMQFNDDEF